MDSLTQASLGAAVAHVCWHKEMGAKALVAGAVIGTIPDLDILAYPFLDGVQRLYWHRGESHSVLFILVGGLVTGWLVRRRFFTEELSLQKAFLGAFYIYATHILIDLFTIYGTQLFAPFSRTGFGFGNFFIIDPLFTLALALGIIGAATGGPAWGSRLNTTGLVVASLYVLWSFAVQAVAEGKFNQRVAELDIPVQRQLTTAAPFTTFLWRHMVETPDGFMLAYWSIFDPPEKEMVFHYIPRRADVVRPLLGQRTFAVIDWFSKGWWCVIENDETTAKVIDMRFTEIPSASLVSHTGWNWPFAWSFVLDPDRQKSLQAVPPNVREPIGILRLLARRIAGGDGWLISQENDKLSLLSPEPVVE